MPHRALEVDDIVREIAAWVVDIHPPTAVSLACCAKSFEEPTLSVLWKTQELPTLIKTLPSDSWKHWPANPHVLKDNITFTRIPSGDEWARFQRYASWVRALSSSDTVMVSDDVFWQLSSATSGGPVCPQLRRLTWTYSYGWKHAQQLLSPYLASVTFVGKSKTKSDTDPTLVTTISLLPTTYLEELRFKYFSPSTPIHSALSEVVRRLGSRFKSLKTESSLSDAAWAHLAYLPNLRSFRVSGTPSMEIQRLAPHENAFPALRSMKINVDNARRNWSFLFPLLGSNPLQLVVIVTSRKLQDFDIPRQVTIAILESKLQQSVRTLVFTEFGPTSLRFISHLESFSSLKILKCNTWCRGLGQCTSPLTDSDIEQLTIGLPRVAVLWLGHGCRYSPHSTTIKSLISLSTHCPSLRNLHLPCNLTNISEDVKTESGVPDLRLGIRSSCKLRYFSFGWCTLPSPRNTEKWKIVASALRHLFPWWWPRRELGGVWRVIFDAMMDFRRES